MAGSNRRPNGRSAGKGAAKPIDEGSRPADTSVIDSLVGYNLRQAATRQRERFRSVFAPHDIRPVQLTALILILDNGTVRQTSLGKALEMKRANVVTLLDQLQRRGFLERRPTPNDRRSYEVRLTPKGRKFTTRMLELHTRLETDLAKALGSNELETLIRLLGKLRRVPGKPKLD